MLHNLLIRSRLGRWPIMSVILLFALQASLTLLVSPEQSLAAEPPCAIRYMTLNPSSETPGPIVSPGMYAAWTGEGLSPSNWQSSAPSQFRAGWKYTVYIADDGSATVSSGSLWDSSQDVALVHYVNRSSTKIYSVTVCPAGGGGGLSVSTEEFGSPITGTINLTKGQGKTFWVTGVSGEVQFLTDPLYIGEWQPTSVYLDASSYWESSVYTVSDGGWVPIPSSGRYWLIARHTSSGQEFRWEVVVDGGTPPPPPPPPADQGPCPPMKWFRLNPGTQMAGHLVAPGMYQVWTAKIDEMGSPLNWQGYGPFEFKSSHRYWVVMDDQTQQDGTVSVPKEDVDSTSAEVYYKNDARSTEYGVVVCPAAANLPPTVALTYSPGSPTPDDIIYFEATASDPDGNQLTYRWFLNGVEQTRATAPSVQWANPTEGTHTMRVVVSDGKGGTAENTVQFTVSDQAPPPGTKTIEQALDTDGDKIIGDLEILQALQLWIKQQTVPGANKTIDDLTMLSLLQKWIRGTPIQ